MPKSPIWLLSLATDCSIPTPGRHDYAALSLKSSQAGARYSYFSSGDLVAAIGPWQSILKSVYLP
jgi:hypothetical protein